MKNHMSNSQYGKWMECESMALAYCRGDYSPPTTDAMLAGSYLDAMLTEDADKFRDDHPEMFKKSGDLLAKFAICDEMRAAIDGDKVFEAAMEGDKQVTVEREFFGVPWVAKMDVVNLKKRFITDLKTTRDFTPSWSDEYKRKVPFYEMWNYWRQMAVYNMLAVLEWGGSWQLYIAAVTKQSPPDKAVLRFDQNEWRINFELSEIEAKLPRIQAIKAGDETPNECGLCEWCRANKRAEIQLAESAI